MKKPSVRQEVINTRQEQINGNQTEINDKTKLTFTIKEGAVVIMFLFSLFLSWFTLSSKIDNLSENFVEFKTADIRKTQALNNLEAKVDYLDGLHGISDGSATLENVK